MFSWISPIEAGRKLLSPQLETKRQLITDEKKALIPPPGRATMTITLYGAGGGGSDGSIFFSYGSGGAGGDITIVRDLPVDDLYTYTVGKGGESNMNGGSTFLYHNGVLIATAAGGEGGKQGTPGTIIAKGGSKGTGQIPGGAGGDSILDFKGPTIGCGSGGGCGGANGSTGNIKTAAPGGAGGNGGGKGGDSAVPGVAYAQSGSFPGGGGGGGNIGWEDLVPELAPAGEGGDGHITIS